MNSAQRKNRKILLGIVTMMCFWVAAASIREYAVTHTPIAAREECLVFRYPFDKEDTYAKVIANDEGVSYLKIYLKDGEAEQYYTFRQLRKMNAKKVECKDEKAD